MFKKKTTGTTEIIEKQGTKRTVVTERVETSGGVTRTIRTVETTTDGPLDKSDFPGEWTKFQHSLPDTTKTKKVSNEKSSTPSKKLPTVEPGKFEKECLDAHNAYRAKHGVPKLKLSKEICSYAKEWADYLAAHEAFKHRPEKKYGENIFVKWSSDPNHVVSGNEAVDSWYSEIKDHVFGREPTSLKSGHFTQVIWKESKEMGVAASRSKSGKVLVVANYDPAGNFIGKFAENVPPPKK